MTRMATRLALIDGSSVPTKKQADEEAGVARAANEVELVGRREHRFESQADSARRGSVRESRSPAALPG
jgi:hypothetical protein